MQASDVKKFGWMEVADWSKLTATVPTIDDGLYVGEMDLDEFVENVFKECARQLNIPYEELRPILEEKNRAFYEEKERIFETYTAFAKSHVLLYPLKSLLKVPDISSIPAEMLKSKVEKILDDYSSLSEEEKMEVLQRLGLINVKCKTSDNQ